MRLTNAQLIAILNDTDLTYGISAIWDELTPKQRLRAEMLKEKHDDRQYTKPKLKGVIIHGPALYRAPTPPRRKTY